MNQFVIFDLTEYRFYLISLLVKLHVTNFNFLIIVSTTKYSEFNFFIIRKKSELGVYHHLQLLSHLLLQGVWNTSKLFLFLFVLYLKI